MKKILSLIAATMLSTGSLAATVFSAPVQCQDNTFTQIQHAISQASPEAQAWARVNTNIIEHLGIGKYPTLGHRITMSVDDIYMMCARTDGIHCGENTSISGVSDEGILGGQFSILFKQDMPIVNLTDNSIRKETQYINIEVEYGIISFGFVNSFSSMVEQDAYNHARTYISGDGAGFGARILLDNDLSYEGISFDSNSVASDTPATGYCSTWFVKTKSNEISPNSQGGTQNFYTKLYNVLEGNGVSAKLINDAIVEPHNDLTNSNVFHFSDRENHQFSLWLKTFMGKNLGH